MSHVFSCQLAEHRRGFVSRWETEGAQPWQLLTAEKVCTGQFIVFRASGGSIARMICVYIYMYMYICMYVYTYMYMYICIYIYIRIALVSPYQVQYVSQSLRMFDWF